MMEKRLISSRRSAARALAAIAAGALWLFLPPIPCMAQGGFGKAGSSAPAAVKPVEKVAPAAPGRAMPGVMRMSKDLEAKFGTLRPDQLVEVDGRTMTVREIRAKDERLWRQTSARAQAKIGKFDSRLAEISKKLEGARQSDIEAHNARVVAELAKLKKQGPVTAPAGAPGANAIKSEALGIQNRVKAGNATPEDEARADELFNQYQQLK